MSKTTQESVYLKLAQELLLPYDIPHAAEGTPPQLPPEIETYLNLMENGLDGTTSEPKRVVIVGAGIAGMYAAKLLKNYGHDVSIVEANGDRVGGRIKTFSGSKYFQDAQQYGEAGAMRFPDIHPLLNYYIDDPAYGFETQKFYLVDVNVDDDTEQLNERIIRCNSIQQRKKEYAITPEVTAAGFELTEEELTASDLLKTALNPVRDLYSYEEDDGSGNMVRVNKPYDEWLLGWALLIEKYDKYSMRGFLEQETSLTDKQIDYIGTIENLTSRMPLSFIHSFLSRSDINVNLVYRELVGGSHNLTDKLHQELLSMGVEFLMDHRVTHIEYYTPETAKHTTLADPISIRSINESQAVNSDVIADLCIVTMPFSSFRFVRTVPDLSYDKRRVVMELHYDAATKVLLEFSERWWEFSESQWSERLLALKSEGKITQDEYEQYSRSPSPDKSARGGGSITDSPNRFMYYPSHPVEGSDGGVILSSYTWADDARRWDSMNEDDRYAFALRGMCLLHGERILPFYTGHGATQSWAESPYAFGEAAVFNPGQMTRLHLATQTVEGPLHFAGEHTSLKHAWVEGSLESACRVALEIKGLESSKAVASAEKSLEAQPA